MWVAAVYHQVSLFSLKPADATSTGGRSLLVPTPFSIKMALLDAALRTRGRVAGEALFGLIRDLRIAASPPPIAVVSNCFVRVQKPRREKGKSAASSDGDDDGTGSDAAGPFQRSVGFREYVYYGGPLGLALQAPTAEEARVVGELAVQISYFGKRGSFFQLAAAPRLFEEYPREYLPLDVDSATPGFLLQLLDDCRRSDEGQRPLTFEQADIYSGKAMGAGRVIRQVAVPYRLLQSSRGFTTYRRDYERTG